MKAIKQTLLIAGVAGLLLFTSCSKDDSSSSESSATVTFDGTIYTKASDSEISYIEFSVDDETSFSIGGDVVNGTDTINFSLNLPNLSETTYTKTANGDEATVTITPAGDFSFSLSTDPFFVEEDLTDYTIEITNASGSTVSGTFSATVQDSSTEETKEVSGEFTAVDFASFFGF